MQVTCARNLGKVLATTFDASSCKFSYRCARNTVHLRSIQCKKLVEEKKLAQENMSDVQVSRAS